MNDIERLPKKTTARFRRLFSTQGSVRSRCPENEKSLQPAGSRRSG
jgi:hypothetical protein